MPPGRGLKLTPSLSLRDTGSDKRPCTSQGSFPVSDVHTLWDLPRNKKALGFLERGHGPCSSSAEFEKY